MALSYKIRAIIMGLICLIVGYLTYSHFDSESLLIKHMDELSQDKIDSESIYISKAVGFKASDDIPILNNLKDIKNSYKAFTIIPKGIEGTDYFLRKPWVDRQRTVGTNRYTRHKVEKSIILHYKDGNSIFVDKKDYLRYYFILLDDGNYILSLIPDYLAYAIDQGEEVKLPICATNVKPIPKGLKDLYKDKDNYSVKPSIYCFNDTYLKDNSVFLAIVRGIVAVIFVLITFFILNKFLKVYTIKKKIDI